MLRNYLKIAFRNSKKNKLISFINIFSLALGIAACLLIFLFIQDEKNFDAQHANSSNIYRMCEIQSFPGTNTQKVALTMPGMGPNIHKDYPEVLNYTRYMGSQKQLFQHGDQRFVIDRMAMVDSTFLTIFDFKLVEGNRETALNDPYTIIISEAIGKRFFGNTNPIGKSLLWRDKEHKITAVMEDVSENSHLQFELLASMTTRISKQADFNNIWGNNFLVTYLEMNSNFDKAAFETKMPDFLLRHMPPDEGDTDDVNDFFKIFFQQLPEVHLASMEIEHDYQNYRKFNGSYLNVFEIVALFILLIAGFNFMNLITARASHRWKEIGVRKSVGALKSQLFAQFTVESVFMAVVAFCFALMLDFAFVPIINSVIGRSFSMSYYLMHPALLVIAFLITIVLGFLAGIYPSYYLAAYNPSKVLKGGDHNKNKSVFRSALVVMQFGLAITMIVSTLFVLQQFWYMQNKDIGFNKDQILLIDMNDEANQKFKTIKQELLNSSYIKGVTASGQRIGNNFHQWGFKIRTDTILGLTPSNVNVDYDYLKVYGIELLEGRDFSKEHAKDKDFAFIINESFAKEIGLEKTVGTPAGHAWYQNDTLGNIIGVVKDFNFNSLHYKINTLAMVVHPDWGYSELSIKVNGDNLAAAISDIERTWNQLVPSWPFEYSFLDEHFDQLYRSDQQMKSVISMMALLAIFIACMGLFGLSAITTERKIKEIGIRKILGASMSQIMLQLSKSFVLLIGLAFLIFSPLTYFAISNWLENFAYRIAINPLVFLVGGLLAIVIALLTISYHTIRSARANPVEALRYE